MADLRVGDSVLWRGGWGNDPEKLVKITAIQINESNGSKYGDDVQSVAWGTVVERRVIVNLDVEAKGQELLPADDGQHGRPLQHWAWGNQIRPS